MEATNSRNMRDVEAFDHIRGTIQPSRSTRSADLPLRFGPATRIPPRETPVLAIVLDKEPEESLNLTDARNPSSQRAFSFPLISLSQLLAFPLEKSRPRQPETDILRR